ncbi:tetratricopeptide repeat protein, partial [Streptomyces avermitilis]
MIWLGPHTRVDSQQLRRLVVRIDSAGGDTVLGTGFFIAPGWVLTCAHVLFDPRRETEVDQVLLVPDPQVSAVPVAAVVTARSAPPQGTVLWPFPDLALLRLTTRLDHPCVRLHPGEPLGGECHAWGFPRREYGTVPPGSPASFHFEGVEGDGFLKLKAGQAAPGLSGAPLLCPVRRAVVGVVCATRDTDSDLGGWASPIRALLTSGPGIPDTLAAYAQEITRLNTEAVLADRTGWNRVLPVQGSDDLLDQPWATFTRKPRSKPSELLLADVAVVPYLFRDTDLDRAQQWCEGPAAFEVAQVAARGGAGKTRFAIELCRRMADHGWTTGLWARDQSIDDIATTALPRLIVIDYTEAIAVDTLRDALKRLANHADPVAPVRLLLLTRTAAGGTAGVLEQVAARANARLRTILADAQDNNAARTLSLEQRRTLYDTAVGAFTDAWYPAPAPHISTGTIQLDQDRHGLPLEVLFEAFDHALSDHQVDDDRAPVDRVLDHEQRYWDATAPADLPTELRRTAVALATLAGAADTSRAHALLALLPHLADPATDLRQRTARWLADLYPGPQRLNPLRPDRLGEALVADVLDRHDDSGRALLASVLGLTDDDQVADCLDVLARLTAASDRATPAVTTVLAARHRELVDRAEAQARGTPQRPGRLTLAGGLTRVFNTLTEGLAAGEPGNTTYARDLSVSYERLADLAVATGQAAEAERLLRQALTIAEGLAAGEPGNTTYARDLSVSYERLADLAVATGQAAEAERLFRQALTIAEGLAAGEPGNTTYARDLSVSYNKLADLA